MIKKLPTLYKRASSGKIQQWTIKVSGDKYWSEYGQKGGKIQADTPTIAKAKNVGRSNETSPSDQALKEATAKWTKKQEKGYYEKIENIDKEAFTVTLAHSSIGHAEKLNNSTVAISPKLDGVRCYITKDGAFSRADNKFVTTKFIEEELEPLFKETPDLILDGELYNHEFKDNFNVIVRLCRKLKNITPSDWDKVEKYLQFHIFDCIPNTKLLDKDAPYWARMGHLTERKILPESMPHIRLVEQVIIEDFEWDADNFIDMRDNAIDAGYEGVMVRNLNMPYEMKRSYLLQKVKKFITEDFTIIGVEEGEGNRSNMMGRLILELPNGDTFKANARGDYAFYKEIWDNSEEYIGKKATHRFMNYTPDGIPRGGAVIAIRDYE